jgi:hypothetical protein
MRLFFLCLLASKLALSPAYADIITDGTVEPSATVQLPYLTLKHPVPNAGNAFERASEMPAASQSS